MADKYADRTPFERDDLVGIFSETLVRAAQHFDPTKNFKFSTYACRSMERQVSREFDILKKQIYKPLSLEGVVSDQVERHSWERYVGSSETPVDEQIINHVLAQRVVQRAINNYIGSPSERKAVLEFIRDPYLSQDKIAKRIGTSQKLVSTAIAKLRKQLQAEMTG